MKNIHYISSDILTVETIYKIMKNDLSLALSEEARVKIKKSRDYLNKKLQSQTEPIYGINTGFGSLCNIKISNEHLAVLQENLVMSHACGTGDPVPIEIIRLMLLLKIQSLSYGYSGIELTTVNRLIEFYNHKIYPIIYTQGSLGASGDLAPLAHLALPLLGKGEVYINSKIISSTEMLKRFNWQPLKLQAKEGLALLNGTQFMSAYGVYLLIESYKCSYFADLISSLSFDAFLCRKQPLDMRIHLIRPHRGQIKTAERLNIFLKGSGLLETEKNQVQDPYSFRCIPQVHGATKDTLRFFRKTIKTEINSVTDNPNIFEEDDLILSGGNFHGQPLALGLDYMAIALSELGSISERRIFQLISGSRNLPAFLVNDPGLNSGLMIPQYVAASITSENKQLATPASIDSIVSSNGQEDHVSMGANSATKAFRILKNIERILAIELLTASQALVFREPEKTSPFLENFLRLYRLEIPFVNEDRILHYDIEKTCDFFKAYTINESFLVD
ncbi:histidine ammonia-lyase [Ascidiimonas sp. W6]|uniref:histidine ammonia-lyase n=1 Tax=Ascidiimonas meishanensis TaxID=3128903 RepID=UPI0030EB2051